VNLTKLTNAQIRDGNNGADLGALTQAQRAALLKDTPLWFYVLRQAGLSSAGANERPDNFYFTRQGPGTAPVVGAGFADGT
jgi:hypothetical protein